MCLQNVNARRWDNIRRSDLVGFEISPVGISLLDEVMMDELHEIMNIVGGG
jgi:hypothetical protein